MDELVAARVRGWAWLFGPMAADARVAPSLVAAIMAQESGGDPRAESAVNVVAGRPIGRAQGLMQVLPGHFGAPVGEDGELAPEVGRWCRQPRRNLQTGIGILAGLSQRFADVEGVIAGYFGAVDENGRPTADTDATGTPGTEYVRLVRALTAEFSELDAVPWDRIEPAGYDDLPPSLCQYGAGWPEVTSTLLGICDDALETGRSARALAEAAAAEWGGR